VLQAPAKDKARSDERSREERDRIEHFVVPERTSPRRTTDFPYRPATLLAPMEGITSPFYRSLLAEYGGIGLLCTEFVRVTSQAVPAKVHAREVVHTPGVPLCVQVMGNDAERMAEAATVMVERGADVIDVNLGCPAPRAVRHGCGAAMLRDPGLLFDVLSEIRAVVPGWFSAKIRAGFDDRSNVVKVARTVEASGVDWITVHPRRRADFYEGVADWRITKILVEELGVPVIGNGDCWYAEDAPRMELETGCAAVMIGRPAIRNPWIFRQITELKAGISPFEPAGVDVVAHLRRLADGIRASFENAGQAPAGPLKEHVGWIGRAVLDGGEFRKVALRLPTLDAILDYSATTLEHLPASAFDLGAHNRHGIEASGRVEG
jgi:nifR3 family TIM-barrel protein